MRVRGNWPSSCHPLDYTVGAVAGLDIPVHRVTGLCVDETPSAPACLNGCIYRNMLLTKLAGHKEQTVLVCVVHVTANKKEKHMHA